VVVAWEASIAVRLGSMSFEVGLVAVKLVVDGDAAAADDDAGAEVTDEAARTASMARAKVKRDCILSVRDGTALEYSTEVN
jgi:hypothetical protein